MARKQGARKGSIYVSLAFIASGVLTYVFQGLSTRFLGPAAYGQFAVLWSATFLTVQVLWIAVTQTLGRHLVEREAHSESWSPVLRAVKRLQISLLVLFLAVGLIFSPRLTESVFEGRWILTLAFVAAVAAYAPEYFQRGVFSGARQFSRLGALVVVESASRVIIALVLLAAGFGVMGPAIAVVAAPLIGVMLVRPRAGPLPARTNTSFSTVGAFRFAGPVVLCVACAQALMNGGPILLRVLGATPDQIGLFLAALILTRTPQYVLSPAIQSLLPHASHALNTEGQRSFDRFVLRATGLVACAGVLMVAGVWLFGELAMRILYGPGFAAGTNVLIILAVLAAFYILSEVLNQALFALGRGWLASLGWAIGLLVAAVLLTVLQTRLLERISFSLATGVLIAALAQSVFYLTVRARSHF